MDSAVSASGACPVSPMPALIPSAFRVVTCKKTRGPLPPEVAVTTE